MNRNDLAFGRAPRLSATLLCGAVCICTPHVGAASTNEMSSRTASQAEVDAVLQTRQTARVTPTTYNDRPAFRLSDGRSEAIIVPSIGRVMSYGFVDGPNLMWSPKDPVKIGAWMNYGGDKNWPAPQSDWPALTGAKWPPERAWDGLPQRADILLGARLRTTSPVAKSLLGARIIREYAFNARGELEINQIVEKLRGRPLMLSIWSITQAQPDTIYLPVNLKSVYKNNFLWFGGARAGASITQVSPSLLRVRPIKVKPGTPSSGYKIGLDSPVSAIVSVKGETAWLLQNTRGSGAVQFPDGAENAGFPVELYDSGDADADKHYIELELLGPLRPTRAGSRWQQTMKWSLHRLTSSADSAAATHREIEKLMPQAPLAKP